MYYAHKPPDQQNCITDATRHSNIAVLTAQPIQHTTDITQCSSSVYSVSSSHTLQTISSTVQCFPHTRKGGCTSLTRLGFSQLTLLQLLFYWHWSEMLNSVLGSWVSVGTEHIMHTPRIWGGNQWVKSMPFSLWVKIWHMSDNSYNTVSTDMNNHIHVMEEWKWEAAGILYNKSTGTIHFWWFHTGSRKWWWLIFRVHLNQAAFVMWPFHRIFIRGLPLHTNNPDS